MMNRDQTRDRARRLGGLLLLGLGSARRRSEALDRVQFNRDIRPILSENCFFCHGPDKKHRDSGLRLDIRDEALAKEAILPRTPEESALSARITTAHTLH